MTNFSIILCIFKFTLLIFKMHSVRFFFFLESGFITLMD